MDLFTLVGKISIDCTEAENKINALVSQAEKLNLALGGTSGSGGTGTTSTTTSTTTGTTTGSDSAATAQAVATGTVAGNLLTKVTNILGGWVVDFSKEGYSYEAEKETYIAELKTMMNSTWEEAEAFFDELNALSISSPLNMGSIGYATNRWLSLGYKPDTIKEMLQVIGDLAKGDNTSFVRITKAVSDVMATSYLQGDERNQFAEAGVPLYKFLADYYGMPYETDAERDETNAIFIEAQRQKSLLATDVLNALIMQTQEGYPFHNAMAIAMETLAGQTEKTEELKQQYSGAILSQTGIMDAFKGITVFINDLMESELERLEEEGLFGMKSFEDAESFGDVVDVITSATTEELNRFKEEYGIPFTKPSLPDDWRNTYNFDPNRVDFQNNTISTLSETIGNAVKSAIADSIPGAVASGMGDVTITTGNVTLNDGALVGRLTPKINLALGQMAVRDMRG